MENPEVLRTTAEIQIEQRVFSLLQVIGHDKPFEHGDLEFFLDLYNLSEEDVEKHLPKFVELIEKGR